MLAPLRYNQVHVFESTVRLQALVAIVAAAYLAHLAWHHRLPGPTALDWPLAGVLAAYSIATMLSIYPRFSLEASFLLGIVFLIYYVFHDVDELSPPLLIAGLAAVGVAAAVYSLYKVGSEYADWLTLVRAVEGSVRRGDLIPPSVPRVAGVGDHVNMIGLAFNLTLPFALLLALQGRALVRPAAGVGALLMVVALFFTVSRAAWVSAVVAVPVFAFLYARRFQSLTSPLRLSLPRPVVAGAVALVVLVLAAGTALGVSRWDSRPEWLFRSSLSPRYDAFDVAVRIFRDEPWSGAGPNTYSLLYNVYSGDYPIEDFHPHNGYLAVLVDAGLIGAVAVGILGIVLLWSLADTYRNGPPQTRAVAAACIAALLALAIHSFADMPNQSKTALALVAVIAALAMKISSRPAASSKLFSARNLPRFVMLAFVPLFVAGWLWTDVGQKRYDDSLDALAKGDFVEAGRKAIGAEDADPDFAAYHFHAGVTQAIAYLVSADAGQTLPGMLDGAVESLRKGVELEPRAGIGQVNLALALQMKGDGRGAVEAANLAIVRAPGDGTVAAVAGTIFEWAGLTQEAIFAYSRAVTHDAGLVESPFWATTPFRSQVRRAVIDNSFLTACQKARVVALYNRYPDDDLPGLADACRRIVEASPSDARARSDLAVALYQTGAQEDALQQARRAVDQAPDNGYARTALGRALMHPETASEARHQLMLGAQLGDVDALVLLSVLYQSAFLTPNEELPKDVADRLEAALPTSGSFVYDRGIQSYLLGILYYRPRYFRESPVSILIPGEWLSIASARTLAMQRALEAAGRR